MAILTADLYDERGDQLDSCDLQLSQYGGRRAFTRLPQFVDKRKPVYRA